MSLIRGLLRDKESVLVFDVDGVLAIMEFGKRHHYSDSDEEWNRKCSKGMNAYNDDKVSSKMQKFLRSRDMTRIYVITAVGTENEKEFKQRFVERFYNIQKENVYCVEHNSQKINELKKIKAQYPELEDSQIIMIDDTVEILTDIMENTDFSTAHISSFLDI